MSENIVLVPGSFDPVTIGHRDIVERVADLFDEVYVVAFVNSNKKCMFLPTQRYDMLNKAFADLKNVHCGVSHSFLTDYCLERGIHTVAKGVRSCIDYEYEQQLALMNNMYGINTIFIPTKAEHMHISSSFVRELIRYGKDIGPFVPNGVADIISTY